MEKWIGVDFDGTLCVDDTGQPVRAMVDRIQEWLRRGIEVRIVTARASRQGQSDSERDYNILLVSRWCQQHIGVPLEVTCEKDYFMAELWDDRAVTVEKDTGRPLAEPSRGFAK